MLNSILDGKSPLSEIMVAQCKTVDSDPNETGDSVQLISLPWMDVLCSESVKSRALRGDL